jgi:hypothetical protein
LLFCADVILASATLLIVLIVNPWRAVAVATPCSIAALLFVPAAARHPQLLELLYHLKLVLPCALRLAAAVL